MRCADKNTREVKYINNEMNRVENIYYYYSDKWRLICSFVHCELMITYDDWECCMLFGKNLRKSTSN